MSCFQVHPAHVHYLIGYAVANRVSYWNRETSERVYATKATANQLGAMLTAANAASVAERYREPAGVEAYRWPHAALMAAFDPVQVIKAVACLDYQSCDWSGWENSEAKAFCAAIVSAATEKLPGYEEAKWGLDFLPGRPSPVAPVRPAARTTAPACPAAPAAPLAPVAPMRPTGAPFYGQGALF